tara:strand:- start:59 stop:373 length:315 start_codon:yes stop_codon:yes gene_type:complete
MKSLLAALFLIPFFTSAVFAEKEPFENDIITTRVFPIQPEGRPTPFRDRTREIKTKPKKQRSGQVQQLSQKRKPKSIEHLPKRKSGWGWLQRRPSDLNKQPGSI